MGNLQLYYSLKLFGATTVALILELFSLFGWDSSSSYG